MDRSTYCTDDDVDKLMSLQEKNKFRFWMAGQTICCVDGQAVYYKRDVDRFLAREREGKETYLD